MNTQIDRHGYKHIYVYSHERVYMYIHLYMYISTYLYISIYIFLYIFITYFYVYICNQLDKLRLSSWLVTLASGLSSHHLTSDSFSSQLVQPTWKVTPLKSHAQALCRFPPQGTWGGKGVRSRWWPKKSQNRSLFLFFCPFFFGENDVVWSILRCCPQREQDLDLVVLLWRWWILRSRL